MGKVPSIRKKEIMQTNNGKFTVLPGYIVDEEIMNPHPHILNVDGELVERERQVTEFAFLAGKTIYWRPMTKPYDFTHSDERNSEFSRLEVEALLSFKTGELEYFAERESLNSFDAFNNKVTLRDLALRDDLHHSLRELFNTPQNYLLGGRLFEVRPSKTVVKSDV